MKVRATLVDAQKIASLPLPHVAAREAYLAVFHAAEAYIFEQTGKVSKTHRGFRSEFSPAGARPSRVSRRDVVTLPRDRLSIQDAGRLCRRLDGHADNTRRGDRCHCHDGALHRHHNPSAAAGPDVAARAPLPIARRQTGVRSDALGEGRPGSGDPRRNARFSKVT